VQWEGCAPSVVLVDSCICGETGCSRIGPTAFNSSTTPTLAAHGIVFKLLNSLAYGFFNPVCRPDVTVDQVEAVLLSGL
jgi:hypothetical protein